MTGEERKMDACAFVIFFIFLMKCDPRCVFVGAKYIYFVKDLNFMENKIKLQLKQNISTISTQNISI